MSRVLLRKRYQPIADAIAKLFGPHVEVVIHELRRSTIVYMANCFSKRRVGDPSHLDEISFDEKAEILGPYEKVN